MPRTVAPLWLAAPSRFARLSRGQARLVLIGLALLIVASLFALPMPASDPSAESARTDLNLYQTIVEGVRTGGDYYSVAARSLRAGDFPLKPFVTFRLPTLAVIEAALPDGALVALLDALALGVFIAWFFRLRDAFARRLPLVVALLLLAGGMLGFVQSDLAAFHEVWAGLLIALSLALRRPGHWVEAVAFGMMAMLIRETAALYVAIMAVLALVQGQRREGLVWGATLGVFAVVIALHAHAVSQVVHATDPASPGWAGMLGFGFFAEAIAVSTVLTLFPLAVAAPLVALALAGWAASESDLGLRVTVTLAAYAVLIALFGRADTFYWGLMIAPTLLVGLAFAPDGVRDLVRAAAERRRITVTRVVR
ncbi:hypothetical protein PX554_22580 [Sphingomonas sp. H39-1-10]|uniref:hypothetical protein n=1 Tax=Sphingomonas pollutisoli TaxID=3030829 RepID=UPI0023BA2A1A|nr:hypothetical protein [Sphingomonas pollutisoli]MDF0490920.1 hypothetical protein [Sphingomonas pollutisoli]